MLYAEILRPQGQNFGLSFGLITAGLILESFDLSVSLDCFTSFSVSGYMTDFNHAGLK